MEYYETKDDYTAKQMTAFIEWFSLGIGTDYELNESASGEPDQYYTLFTDLEPSEVRRVRWAENNFRRSWDKDK